MADPIGWLGTGMFLLGSFLIAYKRREAFIALFFGNLAYIVVGYITELWSLVAVSVSMAGMDVFGWWKWRS